jgi:hypothetical protein
MIDNSSRPHRELVAAEIRRVLAAMDSTKFFIYAQTSSEGKDVAGKSFNVEQFGDESGQDAAKRTELEKGKEQEVAAVKTLYVVMKNAPGVQAVKRADDKNAVFVQFDKSMSEEAVLDIAKKAIQGDMVAKKSIDVGSLKVEAA